MDLKNMTTEEKMDLAQNPNTPVDILGDLAKDEDWEVRWTVAERPNTPDDVLRALAKDEHWPVRQEVAKNPKVSSKILVSLFEYEKSLKEPTAKVIKALYAHKKLPAFAKRVIETLYGEMLP